MKSSLLSRVALALSALGQFGTAQLDENWNRIWTQYNALVNNKDERSIRDVWNLIGMAQEIYNLEQPVEQRDHMEFQVCKRIQHSFILNLHHLNTFEYI